MIRAIAKRLVKRRAKIYFVYAKEHKMSGSTVMRGFQLADIVRHRLKQSYKVKVVPYTQPMNDSIAVFTKGAIYSCSVGRLQELSAKNNQIVFDPVDGLLDLDPAKLQYTSVIIAASSVALARYKKAYPDKKIFFVDHHADPRIRVQPAHATAEPKIGYFGELVNTVITEDIKNRVDFFHVDTSSQANIKWLDRLADYGIHYAVRKTVEHGSVKPATKIFMAAYSGANVVIQDADPETVRWLGKDYPYLIRGKVSEKKILDMLAYAQESYGSKEWKRGLKVMKRIKAQVSEEAVGDQALEVINWLAARQSE